MARDVDDQDGFTGQTFDEACMLARKAVELAHEHRIPPVPKVFEVWFTYAGGLNTTISTRIDRALDTEAQLPVSFIHKLHEEFLSPAAIGEGVARIGDQMGSDLAEVVDLIEDGMSASDSYASQIKRIQGDLSPRMSESELRRQIARLTDANRAHVEQIGRFSDNVMALRAQFTTMQKELRDLRQSVLIDHTTQLPNRRRFDDALDEAVGRSRRDRRPLAVIMADIDHFRAFNDRWGKATGDQVLMRFAEVLRQQMREGDLPARLGGDEFGVILPATSLDTAREIADAIRLHFNRQQLVRANSRTPIAQMTASFGVTMLAPGESSLKMVARLDDYVLRAKEAGRDQVWSASLTG